MGREQMPRAQLRLHRRWERVQKRLKQGMTSPELILAAVERANLR